MQLVKTLESGNIGVRLVKGYMGLSRVLFGQYLFRVYSSRVWVLGDIGGNTRCLNGAFFGAPFCFRVLIGFRGRGAGLRDQNQVS